MAIIYADQVSEIAIQAEYAGREVVNVLHYYNDEGAINDADKAQDILDAWQTHMMKIAVDAYTVTGATWRSLDRDDTNQGTLVVDPANNTTGTIAGEGCPPNVAYLIKKITNNRQRGQRDGRMFFAGVPEAVTESDGTVKPVVQAEYQGYIDAFLDAVNDDAFGAGGGSGLVVLNTTPESRVAGTTEVDLTYRTVSSLVLDNKVASQRDRLR